MRVLIGLLMLLAPAAAAHAADERGTAKTVIWMRGAPCGDITGTYQDPSSRAIITQCSNGRIYAVVPTKDGSGWFLAQQNTLTGKLELYQ